MGTLDRYTQTWTDAGGVSHDPACAPAPGRLVSLVPSLTESLCALGGRARLAGCTAFCVHPPDLLKDPRIVKVGGTKRFSREKLLALRPDLVLLNLEENELDDLEFLRLRVACYVNGVKTLEEGLESLRELGALIGAGERGDLLAREAEADLARARARVAERAQAGARPVRVFYPVWREPWMSVAPDTFIAAHLRTLGAQEVPCLPGRSRYPVVTLAQVAEAGPDVLWLPSEPYAFKERDVRELHSAPGLERVPAELVDGEHLCWFGAHQIQGLPYAYRKLWGRGLTEGPLPLTLHS